MSLKQIQTISKDFQRYEKRFGNLLAESGVSATQFIASALSGFQKTPKLLECTKESLIGCYLLAAEIGLMPNTKSEEAYVIPYGKQAQFQIGYQGWQKLAYRTGIVNVIRSSVVYSNEPFEYEDGLNPKLVHRPYLEGRGTPIATYAIAVLSNGEKIFKVVSKSDIEKFKAISKTKWKGFEKNDPMNWMWQKTAIKQLCKNLPKNERMAQAIHADNVFERGGSVKADDSGAIEIIEVPFETTTEERKEELKEKKANGNSVTPQLP